MFELHDKTGWVGVEAPTLKMARRACEVLIDEGDYELPLSIYPPLGENPLESVDRDANGNLAWRTSDLVRAWESVDYDVTPFDGDASFEREAA